MVETVASAILSACVMALPIYIIFWVMKTVVWTLPLAGLRALVASLPGLW